MNKIKDIVGFLMKAYGHQHWWPAGDKNREEEIIIGAILTQNTAWTNVEKAIDNLRKNKLINFKKINKINSKKLANLIKSSGYYNQKARKLKAFSNFMKKYDYNLKKIENKENLREELLRIHGIGNETADSILLYALNKPIFVVDAYTKRVMHRLKLADENASYDAVQKLFAENLPKDAKLSNEYHALLVKLGKDVCKKKPVCHKCPLADICIFITTFK